jgi:hypothetical protein
MKLSAIAFAGCSVLIVSVLVVGFIVVKPALAQVDATSTEIVATSSEEVPTEDLSPSSSGSESPQAAGASTSTPEQDTEAPQPKTATDASGEATSPQSAETSSSSLAAPETPPQGLTEVNIIGTKYVDYFTDGVQTYSFPGDPEIHAHIAEKDAPIPSRPGLTWVHSTGQYLYDTVSGELEEGQYAVQANGSYIEKRAPFVSSTSTPVVLGASTSGSATPPDTSSTSTIESAATDTTTPTTTPTDSTTAPVTNDTASDASQAPATTTTTDAPSI